MTKDGDADNGKDGENGNGNGGNPGNSSRNNDNDENPDNGNCGNSGSNGNGSCGGGGGNDTDDPTPPTKPSTSPTKEEPPPPPDEPGECDKNDDHCSPGWPWWPWPWPWDPGQPPEPGGGGGGGSAPEVPSGRPGMPPQMQLPPELMPPATEPVGPSAIDVAPGVGIAAAELPIPPITLPVIVAPTTGLGGGGAVARLAGVAGYTSRRDRRATRGPRAAAGQRGQQRGRSGVLIPDRLHGLFAECRVVPASGLGSARRCGHACTHRRRGVGWISPGEGGPCGTHKRHRTVCELTNCPPLRGRTAHSGFVERGLYACQPPRHPRR